MASAASKPGRRPPAAGDRNLLERLLIECVQSSRAVPAESGVRFHVNIPQDAAPSVCLIYHVDLQPNPLVTSGPRPDYLVLHATRERLLLTIVEMKGRGEQDLTHGVDQIVAFVRLLRAQLKEHLPAKLRHGVQGVLLMAHGAHPPLAKLKTIRDRESLVIAPVAYHHSAELYPYISRTLQLDLRYRHETIRPRPLSPLEQLLANGKLPERRSDAFLAQRWAPNSPGIYVNYAHTPSAKRPAASGHAALAADPRRADIGVCATDDTLHTLLLDALERSLGLPRERQFLRLHRIPPP